jgi:hypothetical protein
MRVLMFAAVFLALAACDSGPRVIDGSSKEAAESSIAEIAADLPEDRRAEFTAIVEMGWPLGELAGKTADEVIALGREKVISTIRTEDVPKAQARVADAEAAVTAARGNEDNATRFLRGISLLKPELVWRNLADGSPSPLFTFDMKNETSEAIQSLVFHLTVKARGQDITFVDQRFDFVFAEAVTTGETKFVFVKPDLSLAGNAGALAARDVKPGDFQYGVDFIRVEDLNGRVIMDDEGVAKAEADLKDAKDALARVTAELQRLEAGGAVTKS